MKAINILVFLFFSSGFIYSQTSPQNFHCITFGTPSAPSQYNVIGYYINNSPIEYNGCQTIPAIIIAVIDTFCQPWDNCNYSFGQSNLFTLTSGACSNLPVGTGNCRNRPENYFIFQFNNSVQMDSMASLIANIPNGYFILAYTWFTYPYSVVPIFKQTFQNVGAFQITSLSDSVPYIFFIRKGDLSTLQEIVGTSIGDTLVLNTTINCTTLNTSVSEIKNELISIFPNPSINDLSISVASGNYKWEIYSLTGQQILSGQINNGFKVLDISNLASGMYIFKLSNEKYTTSILYRKLED